MSKKKIVTIFIIITVPFYYYFNFYKKKNVETILKTSEEVLNKSNIIENVKYQSTDSKGNKYIINALTGEVDYSNPNIIYLKDVQSLITLKNSEIITITSDYGRYNSSNFDTIFSKNVIITFLNNKILGEYLDFSILRSSMTLSKNVVYSNLNNIMKADAIEINLETKKAKIFMYENTKKINIKNF